MLKAFVKYLLFLWILLLGGLNPLSAHMDMEKACHSLKETKHVSFDTQRHDEAFIGKTSSHGSEESSKFQITNNEEKEEEITFSKKYSASSNFFTAIFYAFILGYFLRNPKNSLPFCRYFSHFSSLRSFNLLFCVFRL